MRATVRTSGFPELEKQLESLTKGMARGALTRAGVKSLAPMAEAAAAIAPEDTGELAGSIKVSAKAKGGKADIGLAEFSAALRGGGTRSQALSALRTARREAAGTVSNVELYMGPTLGRSKDAAIKRVVQEFGSIHQPGQPYMRPAWDRESGPTVERLKDNLWVEVQKSLARLERKAARSVKT